MRAATPLTAVVFLLLTGCVSHDVADTKHVVFNHPNGKHAAEGRFTSYASNGYIIATVEKRDLAPWKEYLRVGKWRYWHPNGALRAEITYAVAQYDECCVAGPCRGVYERIVGTPQLFDANGTSVTLVRAPGRARIATNCEGGAEVLRPTCILPADLTPEWNPHEPFLQ